MTGIEQKYGELLELLNAVCSKAEELSLETAKEEQNYAEFEKYFMSGSIRDDAEELKKQVNAVLSLLKQGMGTKIDILPLLSDCRQLIARREYLCSAAVHMTLLLGKTGAQNAERIGSILLQDGAAMEVSRYNNELNRLSEKAMDPNTFRRTYTLVKKSRAVPNNTVKKENAVKKILNIKNITPGKMIRFGTYPQTTQGNDCTPIEWLVLDVDQSAHRALLISRYGLDAKPYNTEYKDITWETCTLRSWLNGKFMNRAFSAEEQKAILTSRVTADKNPNFKTNPGRDTQDKVFLLSIAEASRYFKNGEARKCVPTDYAVKQGTYFNNEYKVDGCPTCWWWLRAPGNYSDDAALVSYDGSIGSRGISVDSDLRAVRPALYVDFNQIF